MIKKVEIAGVHTDADARVRKYATKMVGKLERYIPRRARGSVHVEIKLREDKNQKNEQCTAEVIMRLPEETLTAKDSTVNLFAAIDIVEAKLQNQLKKYKDKHANVKFRRRLTDKFRRYNPNQI